MDQRPARFDPYLPQFGCVLLLLFLAGLCLLPIVLVDALQAAFARLSLSPAAATLALIGVLVGGLINIPLYRVERDDEQPILPGGLLTYYGWTPVRRMRLETLVAVNVGGCLVPAGLALYEAACLADAPSRVQAAALVAPAANILACAWLARPIAGVGIALPAFVSPAVAVGVTWLLLLGPEYQAARAPVAFIAGVAGPLLGADLVHLRRFERLSAGMISIGGAGTFDGIVLSGVLAALLA